ncbi:MAG TPA: glutamate formimidoyltransferase [Thermoleophilia bacterium]|nr:glutamate formimidoyltransferase [Thermoleophilia bacterium]
MTLIECVPNFSEGRRPEVVDEIVAAVAGTPGVTLLDRQSDGHHNRSVVTFVGDSPAAQEAAFRAIATAARLIDLNHHEGAHPRFGATDVMPFVPIRADDMPACVEAAHALGARVGAELAIPVYFYEDAARRPERRNLADVRRGEFEGLREVIARDPQRAPDEGPVAVHPRAGAVAIGARQALIAYNVNLDSTDLELARRIAGEIRERDGGLPCLKAMGLALDDGVQVSMNLTDYRRTSLLDAFEAVRSRAVAAGAAVRESEVVGLLPEDAVTALAREVLQAPLLGRALVLDAKILDGLLAADQARDEVPPA